MGAVDQCAKRRYRSSILVVSKECRTATAEGGGATSFSGITFLKDQAPGFIRAVSMSREYSKRYTVALRMMA